MEWIFITLLFFVAWFLQNCIHEGSHLLVGWLVEGRKPLKFIPWPSKQYGKFYFAYYENGYPSKGGSPKWRHIAPLFSAWAIMSVFLFLSVVSSNICFIPFFVCAFVDYCVWVFGYAFNRPRTDGKAFRNSLKNNNNLFEAI